MNRRLLALPFPPLRALRRGVRLLPNQQSRGASRQGAKAAKGGKAAVGAIIRRGGLINADNPPCPKLDTAFRPPRFGSPCAQPKLRKGLAARETIHQPLFLIQAPPAPSGWFLPDLISLLHHVRRIYTSPPGNFLRHHNQIGKERGLPHSQMHGGP